MFDPNDVKPVGLKSAPKTIYLNLGLRITRLSVVPGNRTETTREPLAISSKLQEYEAGRYMGRIHSQNHPSITMIIDRTEAGGRYNHLFKILHGVLLFLIPDKFDVFLC